MSPKEEIFIPHHLLVIMMFGGMEFYHIGIINSPLSQYVQDKKKNPFVKGIMVLQASKSGKLCRIINEKHMGTYTLQGQR